MLLVNRAPKEATTDDKGDYNFCATYEPLSNNQILNREDMLYYCYDFKTQHVDCDWIIDESQGLLTIYNYTTGKVLEERRCIRWVKSIIVDATTLPPINPIPAIFGAVDIVQTNNLSFSGGTI